MLEYYIVGWIIGLIIGLIICALIALIPANIAKNKGYSFGLWWLYGFALFFVAFIHSLFLPDKNAQAADELLKYKELLDAGVITENEFEAKKEQLMKRI